MSDTATRRRIRARPSPRDPLTMRFLLDAPVQDGAQASFEGPDDGAPLARALFAVSGVRKVHVAEDTVTVVRAPDRDWASLKAPIAAAIRDVLDGPDAPLGAEGAAPASRDDDAALLAAVTDLLDQQANPAIASHGGHVSAERAENGTVYLRMSGGCQGCAASAATLRQGIERMLRAALPQIREIVDVTDHAAGTNPFYRDETGPAPAFSRPLPPDAIDWQDGVPTVDADYLAARLGLDPAGLREGLRRGEVVSRTENGIGTHEGQTRITVRAGARAWAAEIRPDGSAHEVPPPRDLSRAAGAEDTLREQVRDYLEELPRDAVPIPYGKLARALGLWAPGSVRKVTRALEATMREDAAAGRPFLAALTVSRGADGRPGRGFFDLARELGRGPEPGETDADFWQKELAAALAERDPAGGA